MLQLDTRIQTAKTAALRLQQQSSRNGRTYWVHIFVCLLLACMGLIWFIYQLVLVAQPARFTPDWHGAQWIQAVDAPNNPVAYFRFSTEITAMPDSAFVTISADQSFRLYVNGTIVGSNALDITRGNGKRAYMYDVISAIQPGKNVIGVRVANLNQESPKLLASLGVTIGSYTTYYSSDANWQSTADSKNVYPRYNNHVNAWTQAKFDASSWQSAKVTTLTGMEPMLTVNPQLYEQPLSTLWMTAGAGHDAYFVRSVRASDFSTGSWMRVVATGPADIFINGQHVITWNGQPTVSQQQAALDYISDQERVVQYRKGLLLGVYDISSYLQPGTNTIAIHVSSPGAAASQVGLSSLSAALSADILISDNHKRANWILSDADWRVSSSPTSGWEQGDSASSWAAPYLIGRPGVSRTVYLPDTPTPRNVSIPSFGQLAWVLIFSVGFVLGSWFFVSFYLMRRYYDSLSSALATTSLAFLPAIAVEAVLVIIGREPLVEQPFPYTWAWAAILFFLTVAGFVLVWMHAYKQYQTKVFEESSKHKAITRTTEEPRILTSRTILWNRFKGWLSLHWGIVLILLVAIPLSCYAPTYEPMWQDELTSYYAARGVLAHGMPVLLSGFLYAKAELYSYVLALSILIFGEQNGALRLFTILEYLVSLPLFYWICCKLFDRRVATLATAMLAFSPSTLIWGHEVRMYEQAQLMVILDLYLFIRALQQPSNARRIYLAIICLVLTYLSHEETFIMFIALLVAVLWLSKDPSRPLPSILYQKHWWIAGVIAAVCIGTQLVITKTSHPPLLGTDQSQQPNIEVSVENLPYYLRLLFTAGNGNNVQACIVLNTVLSIIGGAIAIRRGDKVAIFCTLIFWGSIAALTFLFTLTSDRYVYPILPALFIMSAYTLEKIFYALWDQARAFSILRSQNEYVVRWSSRSRALSLPMRILVLSTMALVCASVFILPMIPLSDYNHLVSKEMGWLYHRHYADYDTAGQYVQQHWRQGDVVIAVSPAISVVYYVGHVDYFFSIDRALYLFERDGRITDTPTGSTPMLNESDFQSVLAAHPRIWIISDNGTYQSSITKGGRFVFPNDFRLVFEGYGSAVYLRGG